MFDGITYEELNEMIKNPRSEDYETYFGDMDLTESEKQKRILISQKLEEEFLAALILLFTMQQYQSTQIVIDWEMVRLQIEISYRNAIKEVSAINTHLENYIRSFSYEIIDSTKEHENDPYYYSFDRARFMSENESQTICNYSEYEQAIKDGKTKKQWIDMQDRRERKTHIKVGGTIKPIEEPFLVGNSLMMFPKDVDTFGAEAKEYINCRCTVKYF